MTPAQGTNPGRGFQLGCDARGHHRTPAPPFLAVMVRDLEKALHGAQPGSESYLRRTSDTPPNPPSQGFQLTRDCPLPRPPGTIGHTAPSPCTPAAGAETGSRVCPYEFLSSSLPWGVKRPETQGCTRLCCFGTVSKTPLLSVADTETQQLPRALRVQGAGGTLHAQGGPVTRKTH